MKKLITITILGLLIAGAIAAQVKITAYVQENPCNKCLEQCRELCEQRSE